MVFSHLLYLLSYSPVIKGAVPPRYILPALCHDLALHGQVPIFVNAKDFVPVLVSDDQFHMIHLPLFGPLLLQRDMSDHPLSEAHSHTLPA